MKVVVALGGNALLRRGEPLEPHIQQRNARQAATSIAALCPDHEVVLTHGNGPQVGLLALQAEAFADGPRMSLDVLGAESAGWIGYMMARELAGLLPDRAIATVITQTLVSPQDPAFSEPTKPIGPVYEQTFGYGLAAERGWVMKADGEGVRRVVPSPTPLDIVELSTIRTLVDQGVLVICVGGGGVPVARLPGGALRGVEAVVDKDRATALLATKLGADAMMILTDVDAVYDDFPTCEHPIRRATVADLELRGFAAGSMGPKVAAACAFAKTGGVAVIGALNQAADALAGRAGTTITL